MIDLVGENLRRWRYSFAPSHWTKIPPSFSSQVQLGSSRIAAARQPHVGFPEQLGNHAQPCPDLPTAQ